MGAKDAKDLAIWRPVELGDLLALSRTRNALSGD